MLDKLGLSKSTYYRYAGGRNPKPDRWSEVRPLVREAFSRTPNGLGYRQIIWAALSIEPAPGVYLGFRSEAVGFHGIGLGHPPLDDGSGCLDLEFVRVGIVPGHKQGEPR